MIDAIHHQCRWPDRPGPLDKREHAAGNGWTLVYEQLRRLDGTWPWDVYLRHEDGNRVPPGPNVFDDPHKEAARLLRALD